MDKRTLSKLLLVILIILTLALIWGNSMESVEDSREKSKGVMEIIMPLLELFVGKGMVTNHLVRKLAHFIEFAVLGAEFTALALLHARKDIRGIMVALLAGLAAACADETIQIFFDRGAQVKDVALDLCGVISGAAAVYGACLIVRRVHKPKRDG